TIGGGESMALTTRPRQASSLVDDAYQAILVRLISRQIEPGARITVDNLVRELGISQTPARQALASLVSEGLVTKTHLVGFRASALLTGPEAEDLFAVRLLLEPAAARWAA